MIGPFRCRIQFGPLYLAANFFIFVEKAVFVEQDKLSWLKWMQAGVLVCILGCLGGGIFVAFSGGISGEVEVLSQLVFVAVSIECPTEFGTWQSGLPRFQPKGQEEGGVLYRSMNAGVVAEH